MKNPQQNVDLPDCQENWENVSKLLTINDTNITSINLSLLSRIKYLGTLTTGQQVVFNTGTTGAIFINGSEFTDGATFNHGLGVVPIFALVENWSEDSGIFNTYVDYAGTTSSVISWAAQDTRHLAHGPGNLTGSHWIAIGIV